MKVVITGTSKGIGRATAERFLRAGHEVIGIDILPSTIDGLSYTHDPLDLNPYTHYQADIRGPIPPLEDVEILINNAGVQDSIDDIAVKSERYMKQQKSLKDIGLYEIYPSTIGKNSTNWLKKLKIKTDYTSLFRPYVKRNINWYDEYSKDYSGLVGIIINMLIKLTNRRYTYDTQYR